MATSVPKSVPVHAYTPHGSTTNWDYDGMYGYIRTNSTGIVDADSDTGHLYIYLAGNAHQEVWLNSAYVEAQANVDHITVNVYWNNGYKALGPYVNQARLECRLYVNSVYVGTQISSFPAADNNESFNFVADANTGDDLDVDVKFVVDVGPGFLAIPWAELEGTFTGVSFSSP